MKASIVFMLLLIIAVILLQPPHGFSQDQPPYLRDRGTGISTSQFGTYIHQGEVLLYPFYEYYRDNNLEYEPFDFGFGSIQEFRGRYRANEGIMFISYGISDRVAVEFEAAVISAKFNKSKQDFTAVPATIEKSGLGDAEGQIRWRWNYENAKTPEFLNYFETVFPTGKKYSLIGTSDWELKLGTGLVKGSRWGTMTFRAAIDYSAGEKIFGVGEYAVEYLKKVSNRFRLFVMAEGADDEIALIPEVQWHIGPHLFLKANAGFGVTSKATDFAPEVGIMFSI